MAKTKAKEWDCPMLYAVRRVYVGGEPSTQLQLFSAVPVRATAQTYYFRPPCQLPQVNRELQKSDMRYRGIFDNAQDAIARFIEHRQQEIESAKRTIQAARKQIAEAKRLERQAEDDDQERSRGFLEGALAVPRGLHRQDYPEDASAAFCEGWQAGWTHASEGWAHADPDELDPEERGAKEGLDVG